MTPSAEGQEKDVLLVLDKQQGKVSAVKGFDKEGNKRTEALRVPKPDTPESKQGYRFDPAKIDWESLKKVGITADTLKNTKDFDRVMRGYKSRNTYTVSGTIGGFYLRPTDVKLSFYQAKAKCPQHLDITNLLARVKETMGK